MVQLLRTKREPIPISRAVRAPIALASPLAVALAVGDIGIGALVSTGALPTVLAEASGPYRYRARRLCGAAAAGAIGYLIGLLTGGMPAVAIPAVVLVAGASALISAAGNNASIAGLQLLVFTVLGSGQHALGAKMAVSLVCFLVGAGFGLLVALLGWTVRAVSPERRAVAHVYVELAAMLSASDDATARSARTQLTTAMNTAYDRLLTARSWLSGRDAAYRKLLTLLSSSTPVVEASVAMVNAGQRAPRAVVEYLTSVAAAIHAGVPPPPPPAARPDDPELAPLYASLAKLEKGEQRQRDTPQPWPTRLVEWMRSLLSGPVTWVAALRLMLCVALAEATALLMPLERTYWIPLTVAIVLKPDFGSVFGRAVLRGIGTVVGVGLGAAVLGIGTHAWLLVVFIAMFAVGIAVGKARNYAILSAAVTPLIILQMELSHKGDWLVVLARLLDTVAGCVIVLVFGYLLWPGSMRPRVGGHLAEVLDTVVRYVRRALAAAESADERTERSRARRHAYRGLADMRTVFQQVVVEPSAAGRQASAWWPVIVGLEQLTDAVTEVVVAIEHDGRIPSAQDAELIVDALAELAASVRDQREPASMPLPDDEQLADVVDRVSETFDAVRGPDFNTRSPLRLMRRFLPLHRRA